ncbi:hypothetical protein SELMODRAFT_428892 [Selaginella moellendorffii]|uniref:BAHD family acyltransferase, clade V n=1 Tax=Selaginella moellendorffii TaxID=88036 RepID=D8T4C0_SELML|nr:hypothetical protein SELMODRAFT_428892 [Selaginella moellendorffii]
METTIAVQALTKRPQSLFFYAPETRTLDVDRLKSSLAEVLDSHDFWGGRLRFNENGRMEIDCSNQGTFFTFATSDLGMDQVTADDSDDFFSFDDDMIKTLEDLPLLRIQVLTHMLGDNGYAISILFHHALVDATSGINFLLNLASINRGDGLYMVPNGDRTQLKFRDPPQWIQETSWIRHWVKTSVAMRSIQHTELTLMDICKLPLSSVVAQVQEAKTRVTDEYVRSGRDFLHLNPNCWYRRCEMVINAWPRLMQKSLELDFGWGKQSRVEFSLDPRSSVIAFLPFSWDGILVSVSANGIALGIFEDAIAQFHK